MRSYRLQVQLRSIDQIRNKRQIEHGSGGGGGKKSSSARTGSTSEPGRNQQIFEPHPYNSLDPEKRGLYLLGHTLFPAELIAPQK